MLQADQAAEALGQPPQLKASAQNQVCQAAHAGDVVWQAAHTTILHVEPLENAKAVRQAVRQALMHLWIVIPIVGAYSSTSPVVSNVER